MLAGKPTRAIGAELRGTGNRVWRGLAPGTRKDAGYFHNNRKLMNHLDMSSEGYPIGSGMVESAAKQYKARFCGLGMRWSRKEAERLLPVRTAIMSRRFDKMWSLAYISPPN